MRSDPFVHHFTLFELNANTIIVTSTIRKHHEVCFLLPHRDSRLLNAVYNERATRSPHATVDEAIAARRVNERVNPNWPGRFVMAALVADVTRVDKLTEQFGRQRLEEGLAYGADSLGSQLAANNNAGDVTFTKHHSAWLICERSPVRGKLERRTGQGNKTHGVSRNLPHLSHRRSPPLVSEVRIIKVGSNKRIIRRTQIANPSKKEDEGELDKDKLYVALREGDEGLDLSCSSSDDELRELYSYKTEPFETNSEGNADNGEIHSTRLPGLVKGQSDKDPRRKRNKFCRGSLKKKIKISRPSLDLEKMLERRVEDMGSGKGPENNIFHPIHQM